MSKTFLFFPFLLLCLFFIHNINQNAFFNSCFTIIDVNIINCYIFLLYYFNCFLAMLLAMLLIATFCCYDKVISLFSVFAHFKIKFSFHFKRIIARFACSSNYIYFLSLLFLGTIRFVSLFLIKSHSFVTNFEKLYIINYKGYNNHIQFNIQENL